jgi:hypothetical protein
MAANLPRSDTKMVELFGKTGITLSTKISNSQMRKKFLNKEESSKNSRLKENVKKKFF